MAYLNFCLGYVILAYTLLARCWCFLCLFDIVGLHTRQKLELHQLVDILSRLFIPISHFMRV